MITTTEYAILAAASYYDTRADINRISAIKWTEVDEPGAEGGG